MGVRAVLADPPAAAAAAAAWNIQKQNLSIFITVKKTKPKNKYSMRHIIHMENKWSPKQKNHWCEHKRMQE